MATDHPYELHYDAIEAVLAYICRTKFHNPSDAEEFASWTRLKLLDNDCALLRSFRGLSSYKTFLFTLVGNKRKDWLVEQRGKFRTSAEAKRLGPIAEELERLVLRDGIEYEQAVQLLISRGLATSFKQCDEIWAQLPRRGRRTFVDHDDIADVQQTDHLDRIDLERRRQLKMRLEGAIESQLAALPPGDALIFKLRYHEGIKVSKIAQMHGHDQKGLYRHFDRLNEQLKQGLLAQGFTPEEIREYFNDLGIDFDGPANEGGK